MFSCNKTCCSFTNNANTRPFLGRVEPDYPVFTAGYVWPHERSQAHRLNLRNRKTLLVPYAASRRILPFPICINSRQQYDFVSGQVEVNHPNTVTLASVSHQPLGLPGPISAENHIIHLVVGRNPVNDKLMKFGHSVVVHTLVACFRDVGTSFYRRKAN